MFLLINNYVDDPKLLNESADIINHFLTNMCSQLMFLYISLYIFFCILIVNRKIKMLLLENIDY